MVAQPPLRPIAQRPSSFQAVVVDTCDFVRQQIAQVLAQLQIPLAREAHSLAEAVKAISIRKNQLIILELAMPGFNGIELINKFGNHLDEKCFIVVSFLNQEKNIVEVIKSGAIDFLPKPLDKKLFAQAVLTAQKRINQM